MLRVFSVSGVAIEGSTRCAKPNPGLPNLRRGQRNPDASILLFTQRFYKRFTHILPTWFTDEGLPHTGFTHKVHTQVFTAHLVHTHGLCTRVYHTPGSPAGFTNNARHQGLPTRFSNRAAPANKVGRACARRLNSWKHLRLMRVHILLESLKAEGGKGLRC